MKLISVQSKGNRLVMVKLLDERFHTERTNLYKVEFKTLREEYALFNQLFYRVGRYKHEHTALKAARNWLDEVYEWL